MDHYEELLHPIDAGTDMGVRYNVNNFNRIKKENFVDLGSKTTRKST
jgi:hypothetical protein